MKEHAPTPRDYEPGMTRIREKRCPIGKTNPAACWTCPYGHATECHHPHDCETAVCHHFISNRKEGGI